MFLDFEKFFYWGSFLYMILFLLSLLIYSFIFFIFWMHHCKLNFLCFLLVLCLISNSNYYWSESILKFILIIFHSRSTVILMKDLLRLQQYKSLLESVNLNISPFLTYTKLLLVQNFRGEFFGSLSLISWYFDKPIIWQIC